MKVLITGASSGIGLEMAYYMARQGHELILVARREKRLQCIKSKIGSNVEIFECDLTNTNNVYDLYDKVKNKNVDILINNAGFGLFGNFWETSLDRELEMIDLNIKAYHILTKLFLKDFVKKDSGYILNVCSSAGFMSGPELNTYYATKNYVTKLTFGIFEELRSIKSNVVVSALCPGPVDTEFNKIANGDFMTKSLSAKYVSKYAIDKMFKRKLIIIPGIGTKIGLILVRLVPTKVSLRFIHAIQRKKQRTIK